MLPKSFSATALTVFQACPARYQAEMISRASQFQGTAANLGSTLHLALENFVRGVKIRKDLSWDLDVLLDLYDKAFAEIFGPDKNVPEYKDGRAIIVKWYSRPYIFEDIGLSHTISLEHKDSFDVPVILHGAKTTIPFNFIIDRLDKLGEGEYRVVDYKSQRMPVTPDDLLNKLQARAYAVAVAIKFKDAKKIWVEFDLLRHDKVSVVFTREDNIATWRMLTATAQAVIDTPDSEVKEVLNPECMYCVRKATCETLVKNQNNGGIMSLTIDDMAIKMHDVQAQLKALGYLKEDLERALLIHASENNVLSFDTQFATVRVSGGSRRDIDATKAAAIVGPEIMADYGKLNLGVIDELLKGPLLNEGQKAALRAAITRKQSDPTIKVVKK